MSREVASLLTMDRVTRRYGARVALLDVSLSLGAGIVGLIGPNGAGKTTWLRLAAGLIRPSTGVVSWCGGLPRRHADLANRIAIASDGDALPVQDSGHDLVRTLLEAAGATGIAASARADEVLERLGLADKADMPIGQLSRGQRQRVKLAVAFSLPASVILLDEPQNALDPVWRLEVAALCREARDAGALVVVSSHILEEVEAIADRLVVLYRGRVVATGPKDAVRRELGRKGTALLVRCSDARALGRSLLGHPAVLRLDIDGPWVRVAGADLSAISRGLASAVLGSGVAVHEVRTEGDDLTSVFRALGNEVR
jgi:ABC-2 type transport system ATP-binding protein